MKWPLFIPRVSVEWLRFHFFPPHSRIKIISPSAAASDDCRNRLLERERDLFAVASSNCNRAAGSHRPADSGGDAVSEQLETRHLVSNTVSQPLLIRGVGRLGCFDYRGDKFSKKCLGQREIKGRPGIMFSFTFPVKIVRLS